MCHGLVLFRIETVNTLEAELPEVLLIDSQLTGPDGMETGRLIAGNGKFAGIELILLHTRAHRNSMTTEDSKCFVGYLSKPIRRAELLSTVIKVLGGKPEGISDEINKNGSDHDVNSAFRPKILLVEDMAANALERRQGQVLCSGYGRLYCKACKVEPAGRVYRQEPQFCMTFMATLHKS